MADEDDIRVGVEADLDEGSATAIANQLGDILAASMAKAAPKIASSLTRELTKRLKSVGGDAFDGLAAGARAAADSTKPLSEQLATLEQDFKAIEERAEATRRTLGRVGADPGLFAVIDRELDKVASTTRRFNDDLERIADNPDLLKGYQVAFQNARDLIFREIAGIQSNLRNLSVVQRLEGNRANQIADRQAAERLAGSRQANARLIVAEQGANAQRLAETRIAGQQRIQQERIQARTRIELVRFTFAQIQALERGIAGVFRATGTVANSAYRSLAAAASRIGNLFTRSNTDLNQGLIGALRQRESTIERSFDRQTRDVRRSIQEQSVILQRFESQASTGVVGALTGRSSLGSLIGGGVAVGGGFALFQGLREGLEVGGDFVQGLAVLQAQLELTEAQMQGVREQSIALGNDITLPGVSALDAAQAIQIAAKQFAALGEGALPAAQAAARGILQLSRATGVAAEEAARVVGSAVNVFGVQASEATAVADQVTNALKNAAGVAFNDYANSFTQAAAVTNLFIGPAQDAISALAETNAAIAVLARGGIVGSDAGTSLRQFFLQANRGTVDANEKLREVTDRAGEAGSVFFDAAGNARTFAESLDILRRGTEGLTDQDLNATLQKLFGSDAARAGALLIRTTEAEFRKLIDANLELGTAAEIAAAQNVGLRGALDALGSVIETQQIKTYERYQEQLGKVVLEFANLLQAFFDGEGIFRVIKAGLTGITVALGGLLAAKAAAESIQFLAIALRALVTPLGLVVTGIAALGAAIGILREVSPEFRNETDLLVRSLTGDLRGSVGQLGDGLARLAEVVRAEVLPRLIRLVTILVNAVAPAVEKVTAVADVGLRVLGSFVAALSGEGITTERSSIFGVAERLGVAVRSLGLAVDGFIDTLTGQEIDPISDRTEERQQRIVILAEQLALKVRDVAGAARDAASAIGDIGSAVVDAVATGDVSTLRDRIVDNFTSFGNFVVSKIEPELQLIVGFIGDFLSGAAGSAGGRAGASVQAFLLGPFQDAARALGRFLGNLITDPRLVQALEQLVALAALTGANFIAGFIQGAASNVDQLGDLIGDQLYDAITAGLKAAFSNPFTFAKILAAAIIAPRLLSVFNRFGEEGARATVRGLTSGLTGRIRTGFNANAFLTGFFGGAGRLEEIALTETRKATRAMEREQRRAIDTLAALRVERVGGDGASLIGPVEPAVQQLERLRSKLGEVGTAGATLRGAFADALAGLGTVKSGVGQVIDGIRSDFQDRGPQVIRQGLGQIGTAFRTGFNALRQDLAAAGSSIGQAAGSSIVAGVGAALSGQALGGAQGGFQASLGLAGIISSALFAGASVGGGPQGAAVATIVGGIGLVTAAWQRNKNAADEAAQKVDAYVDILLRFNDVTSALPGIADQISAAFRQQSDNVQRLALEAGLSADGVASLLADGALSSEEAFLVIAEGLGASRVELERFAEAAGGLESGLGRVRAVNLSGLNGQLEGLGLSTQDVFDLMKLLTGESNALQGALNEADFERTFNPAGIEETAAAAESATRGVNGLSDAADRYYDALRVTDPLQQQIIEKNREAAAAAEQNLANITAAIDELNRQRTADIQGRISELTGQLELARSAAQAARDNLTQFLSGDYIDSARQRLDDLLLSIPNLGSQLDEALTLTPTLATAQTNQTLAAFGQSVSAAIQAGIEEGTINATDPASVRAALAPFFDAISELAARPIDEGGISQATADRLRGQLESLIGSDSFDLLTSAIFDADQEVSRIQDEIDGLNIDLLAKVYFDPAQIRTAAAELGLVIGAIPQSVAPTAATADAAERAGGVAGLTRVDNATLAQAVSDAQLAAERNAAAITQAIRDGASVDTAERNVEVTVNAPITLSSTEPVAAANELVLGLSALARGVRPILAGSRS